MELGGKVTIVCEKTRYSADIEFKLKVLNSCQIFHEWKQYLCFQPFIGGQELTNHIEGKIRLEKDVIYTFSGHWDDEITIVDKATNVCSVYCERRFETTCSFIRRRVFFGKSPNLLSTHD